MCLRNPDHEVEKRKLNVSQIIIGMMKREMIGQGLIEAGPSPYEFITESWMKPFAAEGFTFGYQVVRKETTKTLKRKGTIGWSGATGPIFFIDPKEELIGIYQFQTQPHSQVGTRKSFADWMIKATRSN